MPHIQSKTLTCHSILVFLHIFTIFIENFWMILDTLCMMLVKIHLYNSWARAQQGYVWRRKKDLFSQFNLRNLLFKCVSNGYNTNKYIYNNWFFPNHKFDVIFYVNGMYQSAFQLDYVVLQLHSSITKSKLCLGNSMPCFILLDITPKSTFRYFLILSHLKQYLLIVVSNWYQMDFDCFLFEEAKFIKALSHNKNNRKLE